MRAYDREPEVLPAAVRHRSTAPEHAIVALQRAAGNAAVADALSERSPVLDVIGQGGGSPLPQGLRADMESRFGADFDDVRIHSGQAAADSAASVQAKAYTVGNEIVLGRGQADLSTPDGRHTLAHELTHVLQQRAGPVEGTPAAGGISVSNPGDRHEQAAEATARAVLDGEVPAEPEPVDAPTLQRQPTPPPPAPPGPPAPPAPPAPPSREGEIQQGPLGEVEFKLPTLPLFGAESYTKKWPEKDPLNLGRIDLYGIGGLTIPGVVDLKARLGLFAEASAQAQFYASYGPGMLHNGRIGMSRKQAAVLLGASAISLGLMTQPELSLAVLAAAAYLGSYRVVAKLDVPVHVSLGFRISGYLSVAADTGALRIVDLEAGVEADATAAVHPPFSRDISLYWDAGKLHVEREYEVADALKLHLGLNAFIKAELGELITWERHWNLARTLLADWPFRARLDLHGDPDEKPAAGTAANAFSLGLGKLAKLVIDEDKLDARKLATDALKQATQGGEKVDRKAPGGRAGGRHQAPTGERDDPIPMVWTKPLGKYKNPVWLDTPNQQGREPFYRNERKFLPNHEMIGATWWPTVGETLQKQLKTGRGGVERDFIKSLEGYGFEWDDYSPDHVVDLGWGGDDAYSNLWPLDRTTNRNAGPWHNWMQTVSFNDPTDPPEAPPKRAQLDDARLMDRWFRISRIVDAPPASFR